jgi:1A family penicillin-binding protein
MKAASLSLLVLAVSGAASAQDSSRPVSRPSTGEAWRIIQPAQSSIVLARDGSIIGEIGKQFRTSVRITSLPSWVPQAFVAVEDQRFYKHDGVDMIGIAGAFKDLITDQRLRGASTITQQLAGIMHPDVIDRSDRSPSRKLREQAAALEMEKHYTKDQILEAYLNFVDLGRRWFGVEAAARHYFGKSASRLTLAEAASLASLPKSPPAYDPVSHPEANKLRRNTILDLMVEQGYVTRESADRAKLEPVVTAPYAGMSAPSNYFVDAVQKEAERAGVPVKNGGFRIHTTLDPLLQNAAVNALVKGTAELESKPGYKHLTMAKRGTRTDYLQGAVVAMDPYTGDVRALVGGRNYALAPLGRATEARRQPGSAIKPIVYAKALESNIPINAIVPDSSLEIELITGDIYKPGNFDGKFLGPITIREALVKSRNSVAIQLGLTVTMDSVSALSSRLGIKSPLMPVPASAIGASVVRPIELVTAYTAFANNGQIVEPRMIVRIDDLAGRAVYSRAPSTPQQVLDPRVAFIIRDVLKEAAERGTGAAARTGVPQSVQVAGKTGTTNDNVDVWFMGMTPDLVAGVWLGFDRPKSITSTAQGGTLAAPIWGQMMGRYYASRRVGEWPTPPDGLVFAEIDHDTGVLANSMTPLERRTIELFMPGTEPGALRGNPWNVPRWGAVILP